VLGANNGYLPAVKPASWRLYSPARKAVIVTSKNNALTIQEQVTHILSEGSVAIVVDDGSTDGTPQAAEAAGAWVVRADPLTPFPKTIRQAIRFAAFLSDEIVVVRG
jgi:hypothetical protein